MLPFKPRLRGYLRLLVLKGLEDGAKRLYDILKWVEDLVGVRPSTGALYPVLRKLVEEGLVRVREVVSPGGERVKLYEITDEGRRYLKRNAEKLEEALRFAKAFRKFDEVRGYRLFHVIREILANINELDEDRLRRLRRLIAEFELRVLEVLEGGGDERVRDSCGEPSQEV